MRVVREEGVFPSNLYTHGGAAFGAVSRELGVCPRKNVPVEARRERLADTLPGAYYLRFSGVGASGFVRLDLVCCQI